MSEAAIPEAAMTPRPWWFVGPIAALVPMAFGLALFEGLSFVFPPRNDVPDTASLHWQVLVSAFPVIAAIAVPTATLLVAIMAFAERRASQPWSRWAAAGIAATTPVALYVAAQGVGSLGVFLFGFGLLGTGITYVARHGGRIE